MWAIIFARSLILVVNFSVHPSFTYSEIVSLRHVSLLGEQVSTLDVFVRRSEWQWLATASLILFLAYLLDAATQQWLKGGKDSKRKALAVNLGIVFPMLLTAAYSQLAAFGVLTGRAPNVAWMLGALLIMAYELGRDLILSRRERLELTELRGQLTQAERVSILGQLASTLTHELAQPLGASLVNVEAARTHLRSEKPDLEELRAILDEIGRDDSRAVEIIGRMRQFLKRRTIEMQPVSLEDVVQDVVSIVRSEANSKHVALLLRLEPGLPRVSGDRLHLSQVLLNLVTNSIHAVQSRPPDGRNIVVEAQSDGNGKVEMAVRDSGPGIPDDIADDVFEHFFTTKADGMGVGLALSRSIIEAHGGRLWIDHIPQHDGAIFRLTLNRA
jgi:signal transduction histidine kinase